MLRQWTRLLADYSARQWLSVRAGKVKISGGLFNDTQDADPEYVWTLLPEPIYGVDRRATNLAQYGVELYGRTNGPKHLGSVEHSAYWGYFHYSSNDGYSASFDQQGIHFKPPAFGKTPGVYLRWHTPIEGSKLGGSVMAYDVKGALIQGSYVQPLAYGPTGYAHFTQALVSSITRNIISPSRGYLLQRSVTPSNRRERASR